jgi:[acyl-carrier-protein] S-malonyltransferase
MAPVVPRLEAVLSKVAFAQPSAPVVTNVEATPNADPARVKELLLRQVTGSVRWVECVQALEQAGVTKVVELGPGKVLCGLVKRISKGLECVNVEDPASLEKALAAP